MTVSFIVTTYNVAPYIERCLSSLAEVAQPGDEIIVVDDGSDDGTPALLTAFAAAGTLDDSIAVHPIFLGTNTPGGVGIGANLGLAAAQCDTVFFVDGDDWINPAGFNRARASWARQTHDVMITNYLTHDTEDNQAAAPADNHLWTTLNTSAPLGDIRLQALAFIAVPWRKFYRRAFLENSNLRFPEGDYFFEDNPFHWAVCLAAQSIGFEDRIICYHRVKRPGQTMASTGAELLAFFTHFETIWAQVSDLAPAFRLRACIWLLENMAWHLERLAPNIRPAYAEAGAHTLQLIDNSSWTELHKDSRAQDPAWRVARRLRAGDIYGQIDSWDIADIRQKLVALEQRSLAVESRLDDIHNILLGQSAANSFKAIQSLKTNL